MIYLNEEDIKKIGIDWKGCTDIIREAIIAHAHNNTVQPVKPYLRFGNMRNRIIAMPAFVGEKTNIAGIKWIASFPDNIKKNLPRASSVTILNDSETGQVVSVINTSIVSIIRTVSVSSLVIRYFIEARRKENLTLGIIGLGPIGIYHLNMCQELYKDKISKIFVYDVDEEKIKKITNGNTSVLKSKTWQEAYVSSDVVITCTVSNATYIDQKPKDGSLLLNVSLRDYTTKIFEFVKDSIIVDDWEEVCREKTDIEVFHIEKNLQKEQVKSIDDIVTTDCLKSYPKNIPIMFNPMGMAIFDIAIAKYYLDQAQKSRIGLNLQ